MAGCWLYATKWKTIGENRIICIMLLSIHSCRWNTSILFIYYPSMQKPVMESCLCIKGCESQMHATSASQPNCKWASPRSKPEKYPAYLPPAFFLVFFFWWPWGGEYMHIISVISLWQALIKINPYLIMMNMITITTKYDHKFQTML